jgi:hypothetical protein
MGIPEARRDRQRPINYALPEHLDRFKAYLTNIGVIVPDPPAPANADKDLPLMMVTIKMQ